MDLARLQLLEAERQKLDVLCFSELRAAGPGELSGTGWAGRCSGPWVSTAPGESRSRLRWGLSRLRKGKESSQPNLSASTQEDLGQQYVRSESGRRDLLGE